MILLSLIEYVKTEVDPVLYFSQIHGWKGGNLLCPFHDMYPDSAGTPTFGFNVQTGGGQCFNPRCEKKIGNIVHFHSEWRKCSEATAAREIYINIVHPLQASVEVNKFVKELHDFPFYQKQIEKQLGLSLDTQAQFKLGIDPNNNRIIIPIPTQFGPIGFFRAYKLPSDRIVGSKVPKIINKPKGSGRIDLFPWNLIRLFDPRKPVLLQKAERDTMLSTQLEYQSFCTTGSGETASIEAWAHLFSEFQVFIIPDQDEAGSESANKKLKLLRDARCDAYIANLPDLEKGKDFSDYILKNNGTKEGVDKLLREASEKPLAPVRPKKQYLIEPIEKPITQDNEIELVPLSKVDNIYDRTVECNAIIIGTMDERFRLPIRFSYHNGTEHAKEYEVPLNRELIHLMRKPDKYIAEFLKEEIVGKKMGEIKILEWTTATEIELAPTIDFNNEQAYLSPKTAVILGSEFQTNTPYLLTLNPTTTIDGQKAISVIIKNEPMTEAMNAPDFNDLKELGVFRAKDETVESYEKQLNKIVNEVSTVYTRIYERYDLHLVSLLTWLSPLYFNFGGDGRQRGWINSLNMGDTQTGKTDVARAVQQMFGCGAFMSGENCTFVGLVGGAVRSNSDRFILRWGRIPINDRQLVVIEELSGLQTSEIGRMSEVRSSGIARIDKGGITAETNSRTRLLCLSNVRGQSRGIESYPHGVDAILELVGQPEDVSRFDLICTLADKEVKAEVMNSDNHAIPSRPKFTSERFNKLARLVWSLTEDQINITDEAIQRCKTGAMEMGSLYTSSIPIFKASSGRIKLARIACAIASLLYSFSENDDKQTVELEVNEHHVQCAMNLLMQLYDKASFGYRRYSLASNSTPLSLAEANQLWKKCCFMLGYYDHISLFRHLLQTQHRVDGKMFVSISALQNILIHLTKEGVCIADKGAFEITAKGRNWIHDIDKYDKMEELKSKKK